MPGDIFIACSKLEAVAIYLVKQACGNDILASGSVSSPFNTLRLESPIQVNELGECSGSFKDVSSGIPKKDDSITRYI